MNRHLIVGASFPVYSPDQVAGLSQWLRGSDITGLITGAKVASWPAATGSTLSQSNTNVQPLYQASAIGGQPGIGTRGSKFMVSSPYPVALSQPITFFCVAQLLAQPSGTMSATMVGGYDNVDQFDVSSTASGSGHAWKVQVQGGAGSFVTAGKSDLHPHIFEAVIDGAKSVFYIDGLLAHKGSIGTTNGTVGLTVGCGHGVLNAPQNYASMYFCEYAAYGGAAVDAADRVSLRKGLAQKYGIRVQIP